MPRSRRSLARSTVRARKAVSLPQPIMQLATGFLASRTLLSAVELGLFTELAKAPRNEVALRERLGVHPRASKDFFDGLVALGMLERRGTLYRNTPDAARFLDRAKPNYIGGLLEMFAVRLYGFWGSLTEALRTGMPQNEAKSGGDLFGMLCADPVRLRSFLAAMTGVSMGTAHAIAHKFPWMKYQTFCDIGGAQGCVSVQLALAHAHLTGGEFDLPAVEPIYMDYVKSFLLERRLKFIAGNFFKDPLPGSDVLMMGHILHDWDLHEKRLLLDKAYAALPKGGALIVYDAIIDDARKSNVIGLMMSLNMLIETPGGFDYTGADCRGWMKQAGFRRTSVEPLAGAVSMVVGIK
jgi:hypothetical protein